MLRRLHRPESEGCSLGQLRRQGFGSLAILLIVLTTADAAPGSESVAELAGGAIQLDSFELTGSLELDRRAPRPKLTGNVVVHAVGRTAPDQEGEPTTLDAALPWELLDAMDLDVRLSAKIRLGRWDFESIDAHLVVKDSRLALAAEGRAHGGELRAHLDADASTTPPEIALTTRFDEASVATFVEGRNASGRFDQLMAIRSRGRTPRELMAASNGTGDVRIGGGVFRDAPLGPLGRDLFQIFVSRIDKDKKRAINCVALHGELEDGIGEVGVVLDTDSSTLAGAGIVDLHELRADLVLTPRSKGMSVGAFNTPIRVSGPLGELRAEIDVAAIARETGRVVLFGVLSPWLLVVPLVDMGSGDSNACQLALETPTAVPVESEGIVGRGVDRAIDAGDWLRGQFGSETETGTELDPGQ